jgi:transcription initiation factor IIE alpha subunit
MYLEIQPTRELKHLLKQSMEWRDSLMQDVEGDQVVSVLKNMPDQSIDKEELKSFLQMYSMTYAEAEMIMKRLRRQNMIEFERDRDQNVTVHLA